MGKVAKAYAADDVTVAELRGQSETAAAERATTAANDLRAETSRQLGGDQQLSGPQQDERLGGYSSRYEIDQEMRTAAKQREGTYHSQSKEQKAFNEAWFNEFGDDHELGRVAQEDRLKAAAGTTTQRQYNPNATGGEDRYHDVEVQNAWSDRYVGALEAGTYYASIQGRANDKFDEAEDAAKAGDWELAATLRAEGEAIGESAHYMKGTEGVIRMGEEDAATTARTALQSPMAMAVGKLVKQGQDFLDPESGTSQRFKDSLTSGARENIERGRTKQLRALAGGVEQAKRSTRDLSLQRGGGRNFAYEAGAQTKLADAAGGAQANVHLNTASQLAEMEGESARFFESFSRDFAANSVQAGQAFIDNQAGIRDQFVAQLNNLSMAATQFSAGMADRSQKRWDFEAQQAAMGGMGSVLGKLGGGILDGVSSGIAGGIGDWMGGRGE